MIEIFYLFSARALGSAEGNKGKNFLIMTFDLIRKKVTFIVSIGRFEKSL